MFSGFGQQLTVNAVDFSRAGKRPDILPLLARELAERCKAVGKQICRQEADSRINGVCGITTTYYYSTRVTYVPRRRRREEWQEEEGEGAAGPAEEQTTRAARHWAWEGRAGWCKRDSTCRTELIQGHDSRSRCECYLPSDGF